MKRISVTALTFAAVLAFALPASAGQSGDDTIWGTVGPNHYRGGRGDDVIYGRGGRDVLRGGPGFDVLVGGRGFDTCFGGPGDLIDCEAVAGRASLAPSHHCTEDCEPPPPPEPEPECSLSDLAFAASGQTMTAMATNVGRSALAVVSIKRAAHGIGSASAQWHTITAAFVDEDSPFGYSFVTPERKRGSVVKIELADCGPGDEVDVY